MGDRPVEATTARAPGQGPVLPGGRHAASDASGPDGTVRRRVAEAAARAAPARAAAAAAGAPAAIALAAPAGGDATHLKVLTQLARALVKSEFTDGLRAATLLAVGHDPASVHYVPEPLDHTGEWVRPGQAWVCRVPKLDLGATRPDGRTWRSLGAAGR
ncbi:MAG: hypothetical protein L0I24_19280, partial [Pseudonocardia sp.]|nr:hypothetical protein [Pseudonocardia sp.]